MMSLKNYYLNLGSKNESICKIMSEFLKIGKNIFLC